MRALSLSPTGTLHDDASIPLAGALVGLPKGI
jgi:hypothetical protein